MIEIQSEQNKLVKDYQKILRGKQSTERDILLPLEGFNLINAAISQKFDLRKVFFCEDYLKSSLLDNLIRSLQGNTELIKVSRAIMKKISTAKTPQGLVGVASYPIYEKDLYLKNAALRAVLVNELQDPGNLGTIIRTAAAANFDLVLYTPGTVSFFNPKVLRSTAGAIFNIKVLSTGDINLFTKDIRDYGLEVIVSEPLSEVSYCNIKYTSPFIIVIGNESQGIRSQFTGVTAKKISIPMKKEVESLNAGVAASIIIYEAERQKMNSFIE